MTRTEDPKEHHDQKHLHHHVPDCGRRRRDQLHREPTGVREPRRAAEPAGGALQRHLRPGAGREPAGSAGFLLRSLQEELGAGVPHQHRFCRPAAGGVPALQDPLPQPGQRLDPGAHLVQSGGQPLLHEHVHQRHAAGPHQRGPLPEDPPRCEGAAQAALHQVEQCPLCARLARGPCFGCGAADVQEPLAGGEMFPLQGAAEGQVEGLHQRVSAGGLLARLHLPGGVLREDRSQASEDISGEAGPAQRLPLHPDRQEVLLHPLPLHRLLRPVPRGQGVLHKDPDHGHVLLLARRGRQSQRGGPAVFRSQQLPGPRHVLPGVLLDEEGGAALGGQHVLRARRRRSQREHHQRGAGRQDGQGRGERQLEGEDEHRVQPGSEPVSLRRAEGGASPTGVPAVIRPFVYSGL